MSEDLHNKESKKGTQVNARLSAEDIEILEELKKITGLGTAGIFKLLIREGLQNRKDSRNANYSRKLF